MVLHVKVKNDKEIKEFVGLPNEVVRIFWRTYCNTWDWCNFFTDDGHHFFWLAGQGWFDFDKISDEKRKEIRLTLQKSYVEI